MRKKIAIIFTGGTISMKVDERIAAAIPALSGSEIMSMVTNIDTIADVEEITFGSFPGPQMTPGMILELSNLTKKTLQRHDIDGVVITHGTDSLEETAYFLDLAIRSEKPIVFVAAMRNNSELGNDGPANLAAAICTAASEDSKDKGVLIVLNNEVNSAREATKTHTLSLDTFKSLEFGPIGIIDGSEVIYYRNIVDHEWLETSKIEEKVMLLKSFVGMNSEMIHHCIDVGYKGFVIEAMGRGNLPPMTLDGIKRAVSLNIPVVIVSRCPMGRVLDSYGYEGGGRTLKNAGAIFGFNLNGQKARIKLMLALGRGESLESIRTMFENISYVKAGYTK